MIKNLLLAIAIGALTLIVRPVSAQQLVESYVTFWARRITSIRTGNGSPPRRQSSDRIEPIFTASVAVTRKTKATSSLRVVKTEPRQILQRGIGLRASLRAS